MKYALSAVLWVLVVQMNTSLTAVGQNAASTRPAAQAGQTQAPGAQGTAAATEPQQKGLSEKGLERISKEVRHQLVLLPFYSVFDNLEYQVAPDGAVTLSGQVVNPTLKSDAENAVKHIEGVEKVTNNIQVLPVSPNDDRIRRAVYRAIYSNEVLSQYELRAVPPIHIIVNNGRVTLEGVVSRPMDKQIAEMQAKSVPGAFSVTNHLRVESE
jgi:hyperosmotically inducible protein